MRREGKRIRTGLLEVRSLASPLRRSRVGIIVPRYKHTAVARNRLKRRLRELARLRLLPALADLPPADVVVRVWPSAYAARWEALVADVERVVGQMRRTAERRADGGTETGDGRGRTHRSAVPMPPSEPVRTDDA